MSLLVEYCIVVKGEWQTRKNSAAVAVTASGLLGVGGEVADGPLSYHTVLPKIRGDLKACALITL